MAKLTAPFLYLLLVSFIEGFLIMLLEIAAACLLAPYFGNTLQSWSTIIGVTFIAYAAGYFVSGKYLILKKGFNNFSSQSLISGVFLLLMAAGFQAFITNSLLDLPSPLGILTAAFLFLFIPVSILSSIPIIVSQRVAMELSPGKANGLAFFSTTVGGIVSALVTGFIFIPQFGTSQSILITGLILCLLSFILLLTSRTKILRLAISAMIILAAVLISFKTFEEPHLSSRKTLYQSDGILGQVIVADDNSTATRNLYLNGSTQSAVEINTLITKYGYVTEIMKNTTDLPDHASILLLGLGGGYLAKHFSEQGHSVDIVELDRRIVNVAATYFGLDSSRVNVFIDDARHFVNVSTKKYDLIIIDIYTGDNAPFHLITHEAFMKMRGALKENGTLGVYFPYSVEKNIKKAHCRMQNTLVASGFTLNKSGNSFSQGRAVQFCKKTGRVDLEKRICTDTQEDLFRDNNPELELLLRHQVKVVNTMRRKLWRE